MGVYSQRLNVYNARTMLPSLNFGGSGPELHFAVANGYPAPTYRRLLAALAETHHVQAMVPRPLWEGSRPEALATWEPLVEDLIQYLDERGARGWVGVGHSLGAVVGTAAALRRPDLFRALVLIEPVFLQPSLLALYGLFQRLGLAGRVHPLVPGARRRRRTFESAAGMFDRYRRAAVFSRLDDAALRDYTEAALRPQPNAGEALTLAWTPEWEARIYETGPLNLWSGLKRLKPPMLAIRGGESDTFTAARVRALRQALPRARIVEVAGASHLVGLEQPEVVARLIREFLAEVESSRRAGDTIPT